MLLYILIFFFSLLLLIVRKENAKKIGGNILLLFMAIMCMLRGEDVGIDTHNYIEIFYSGYRLAFYILKDPIYGAIGTFIYDTTGDYRHFQILMGIITYIPLFVVFNKKSDNIAISILIFVFATNRYFFETFNMVRQAAAASYLLWCWVMIEEKKYIKALILLLIASGLHHTSLIYLPLALFAWKVRLTNEVVSILIISTLMFSLVFSNMSMIVSFEKLLLSEDTIGKYDTYAKELARSIWGMLPVILPYSVLTIFYYKQKKNSFMFRLFAYGTIFANFIAVLPMSFRISYGVIACELLIYPSLFSEKRNNNILLISIVFCLILFSLFDFFTTCDIAHLVPYETFS